MQGTNFATELRYFYSDNLLSPNLVNHCFAYLSAVIGVKFKIDNENPQIYKNNNISPPDSVVLNYNEFDNGSYDIISILADKMTLSLKQGPFANSETPADYKSGPGLSRLIWDFKKKLFEVGAITKQESMTKFWPNDYKFGVALTHDVDIARRTIKGGIRLLYKKSVKGGLSALVDSCFAPIKGRGNPYDAIGKWITIEKDLKLKSTFYIFAGNRLFENDPVYNLNILSDRIAELKENGFEIALHSSAGCYDGNHIPEAQGQLSDYCGNSIDGIRPHYMSAFLPEFWRAIEKSGFSYSSCLGSDQSIGFFRGIDLPFVPFDRERDRALNIVEIPLAIMDCGLIGGTTANEDSVFDRAKLLINDTSNSGGLIVLDWHQRTLYERDFPGWGNLFIKIVEYMKDNGAYFGTMSEISKLVKSRMSGEF